MFRESLGALLILGAPGAGKTTLLLELLRDLLVAARVAPDHPVPVVLNLSSWALERATLADWLVEELNVAYELPRKTGQEWLANDRLLLLLDGLDEVAAEHREACVSAINDFRREHGMARIAVCSRIGDYEALTTRLRLHTAVLVEPLTPAQVDTFVASGGARLAGLRTAMQHEPELCELAQTPLLLGIMVLAYEGVAVDMSDQDIHSDLRTRLFSQYVERMFQRRSKAYQYRPFDTTKWLHWLAHQMVDHNLSIFYLDRTQPTWLPRKQQWVVQYGLGIAIALFTLLIGILGGPIGIVIGLPCGIIGGRAAISRRIKSADYGFRWSCRSVLYARRSILYLRQEIGGC